MTDEFVLKLDDYTTRCLINSRFFDLYKEKGVNLVLHRVHHVSSWFVNYPSTGGMECFSYKNLGPECELVVVCPNSAVTLPQMLDHILKNNGFALSKDNLFMLPELTAFKDYLLSISSKEPGKFNLVAPAHKDNLINHQYLYYPCLGFEKRENKHIDDDEKFHQQMYLNYQAARVDMRYNPKYLRFAYFRKV